MKVPFTSRPHLSKPSTNFLKSRHSVVLEGFGQFLKLKCPTQSMMSRTNSGMSQVKILSDLGSKWKRKFSSTSTGFEIERKQTKSRAGLDAFSYDRQPLIELSSSFFSQVVFVKLEQSFIAELCINDDASLVVIAVYNAAASRFVFNVIAGFLALLLGRVGNGSVWKVAASSRLTLRLEKIRAVFGF